MLIGLAMLANDYLGRHKSFYAFAQWSMVEYAPLLPSGIFHWYVSKTF